MVDRVRGALHYRGVSRPDRPHVLPTILDCAPVRSHGGDEFPRCCLVSGREDPTTADLGHGRASDRNVHHISLWLSREFRSAPPMQHTIHARELLDDLQRVQSVNDEGCFGVTVRLDDGAEYEVTIWMARATLSVAVLQIVVATENDVAASVREQVGCSDAVTIRIVYGGNDIAEDSGCTFRAVCYARSLQLIRRAYRGVGHRRRGVGALGVNATCPSLSCDSIPLSGGAGVCSNAVQPLLCSIPGCC